MCLIIAALNPEDACHSAMVPLLRGCSLLLSLMYGSVYLSPGKWHCDVELEPSVRSLPKSMMAALPAVTCTFVVLFGLRVREGSRCWRELRLFAISTTFVRTCAILIASNAA